MERAEQTPSQIAASRANGAKSQGPTTAEGKASSSMNAVSHGVFSKQILLPGEDFGQYRESVSDYFLAFAPKNGAEANVVAEIADLAWRLQRLSSIENGIMMRRLQEHLEETKLFRLRYQTRNCLIAVRSAASTVEEVAPRGTVSEMASFLDGLDQLLVMLWGLEDLPAGPLGSLEAAQERLLADSDGSSINQQRYRDLGPALRKIEEALGEKLLGENEQLEELKKEIAKNHLLLNGHDLKRLEKYRRGLEQATARQLETLKTVRASSVLGGGEKMEVQLRVVK
jgi:hypothetical protein